MFNCFMGLPCVCTKFPNLSTLVITSQNLFPGNLVKEFILVLLFSYLSLLRQLFFFKDGDDIRPSPSLVPVPFHIIGESIKRHLPSAQYADILNRRESFIAKESCVCVVCMNPIEASDEVRELRNCCHVFHKTCLDVWIGQGQATCPLCRSKLFPLIQREELGTLGGDPWRMERMVYLFGEDYNFMAIDP